MEVDVPGRAAKLLVQQQDRSVIAHRLLRRGDTASRARARGLTRTRRERNGRTASSSRWKASAAARRCEVAEIKLLRSRRIALCNRVRDAKFDSTVRRQRWGRIEPSDLKPPRARGKAPLGRRSGGRASCKSNAHAIRDAYPRAGGRITDTMIKKTGSSSQRRSSVTPITDTGDPYAGEWLDPIPAVAGAARDRAR
jgi:hypothetical protein